MPEAALNNWQICTDMQIYLPVKRLNVMVFLWSFFDYIQVFMQSIAVPPSHPK